MYKYKDFFLCLGVFVFFLGAVGLAFGLLDQNSPLLPVTAATALVLIGVGGLINRTGKDGGR